ncbi:MAG: DUF4434 domain-containing protein [Lentisphaeria bacterium]|nr:DUF4434 domain-containing protein [Lentisphaeria bacterium]
MKITATFLDEISHDIPHQNWGPKEWDADFQAMKAVGIDTVVLIRCGWKRWMTFSSEILRKEKQCFEPTIDLVQLFLDLAEKYGMKFFFGTYDSGNPWWHDDYPVEAETALMTKVNDEFYAKYGKHPAFGGWYLSQEICGKDNMASQCYRKMALHLKEISGNLPILISPAIQGAKAYNENMVKLGKTVDPAEHEADWDRVLSRLQGYVDIVAFQDGHVEIELLPTFLKINKKLCDKYGIQCWTNTETFDRDMPIDFLPIKWDKLYLKLKAAEEAGFDRAMTFEFSHFLSPNSSYRSANHLYNRYREYLEERGLLK